MNECDTFSEGAGLRLLEADKLSVLATLRGNILPTRNHSKLYSTIIQVELTSCEIVGRALPCETRHLGI